ncbi:MAG: hypothetical protein LUE99_06825 [Bacteroides sp.]|nr:hypothetical protein [Bacteroides sp.]
MKTSSFFFKIVALLLMNTFLSCQEEERMTDITIPSSKDIIIQISDVLINPDNGWEAVNTKSVNSEVSSSPRQSNENGLDMGISTSISPEAHTRAARVFTNSKLRVVAYKCSGISAITTGNYAGYGDYTADASGNLTATTPLVLSPGTYSFVLFSYGNAALPTFNKSSITATATSGQDFLSSTKANVAISANYGKYFWLTGLTLTRRISGFYITMQAQSGRMDNITACAATLTVPAQATYSFTTDKLANGSGIASINAVWKLAETNKMRVKSEYIRVLPQASANIPVRFTQLTIGGKSFVGTIATIALQTFQGNDYTYESVINLTTSGYIIGGALWAPGNLYYDGSFKLYQSMSDISINSPTTNYWYWNRLTPTGNYTTGDFAQTTWQPANDPCRQVGTKGTWCVSPKQYYANLIQKGYKFTTQNGNMGLLMGNMIFFPYSGYYNPNGYVDEGGRGVYWVQESGSPYYGVIFSFEQKGTGVVYSISNYNNYRMAIRCIRAN